MVEGRTRRRRRAGGPTGRQATGKLTSRRTARRAAGWRTRKRQPGERVSAAAWQRVGRAGERSDGKTAGGHVLHAAGTAKGRTARRQVDSRTYGLATAARDKRQGRERTVTGERAGELTLGWAAAAMAGQPQWRGSRHISRAAARISRAATRGGGQSVGRERREKQRLYSI